MTGPWIVYRGFCLIALLTLWSCAVSYAGAQVSRDTLTRAVIVAHASRDVVPVSRLDGAALQRLSSVSVADALKYFSGVQIKDYGGIGGLKTVNVRSLGAQHVGVFLDGVRIENSQNGQVDLGRYSLDNMESVSLYNAHKAETLQVAGEYASGATVHMVSRRPSFSGKDSKLKARLSGGSFGTASSALRYERKVGGSALSADCAALYSKGDYRFRIRNSLEDTTARRYNGDIRYLRAEVGLWSPVLGGSLHAHGYFYSSGRGLPGPVVRRLSDQYASRDRQWDRNSFVQSSFRRDFSGSSLLLNAKAAYDRLEYRSEPAPGSASVYAHNTYRQRSLFGSAAWAWYPLQWLSANVAADFRWSDLRCDVTGFSYTRRADTKAVAALTASLWGVTVSPSLLYTRVRDFRDGSPSPMSRLSPSVTAAWKDASGTFNVRAFCKSTYRPPTLNDLYYVLVGNASLRPERATQADIGFDLSSPAAWRLGKARLSADAWLNRVTDKIVAMPAASQFRWTMMNFGKVRGHGADVRLDGAMRLGDVSLSALVRYSYEVARDMTDRRRITWRGQIPYTPWHSGSAVLGAGRGDWSGNVSLLCTGVRYRSADNTPSERLAPWTTVDMGISRMLRLRGGQGIEIRLDVSNLLNRHYEVVTRYPMPGTSCMMRLTYTI